ncbi:hypothetical protein LTR08_001063 [Meristemomyces frigidus]|nr:hypothetical protein LTR08_001063 [Meristemomyces frigidus]
MDRDNRRDDGPQRRSDTREHKPRTDGDRSRSPQHRDRRDDRRRDRSPYRGSARGGGGRGGGRGAGAQHPHGERERDFPRGSAHTDNSRGGGSGPRQAEGRGGRRPHDHPHHQQRPAKPAPAPAPAPQIELSPLDGEDEDATLRRVTEAIQGVMGFGVFRTTKNTKVPGNDKNYAVGRVKKAEYRQYMNRVGGFNRPLSPGKL